MAMGAHRSSLREDSQVSSAALAFDIINGQGKIRLAETLSQGRLRTLLDR
jgi:hypothetical protein